MSSKGQKRPADEMAKSSKKGQYQTFFKILASPSRDGMAQAMCAHQPERFEYHPSSWGKFPDGTDHIKLGGFVKKGPGQFENVLSGQHVVFLADFANNDTTLSQFHALVVILQSFVRSLTVVLPFYPTGTMERVVYEGEIATANTLGQFFSCLPSCGKPTRLMVYDLHTLQNRFYLSNHTICNTLTTFPCMLAELMKKGSTVDCIAFPDDGANKRFGFMFAQLGMETVICGKIRGEGDERSVVIQTGNPKGKNCLIVDDLVQSGGTLAECAIALKASGSKSVSAFVPHAVFPNDSWKRFAKGGDRAVFDTFTVTNSIPTTTDKLPKDDVFKVLDLTERICEDLGFSA